MFAKCLLGKIKQEWNKLSVLEFFLAFSKVGFVDSCGFTRTQLDTFNWKEMRNSLLTYINNR